MTAPGQYPSVRYLAGDAQAATGSCTTHPGVPLNTGAAPASAGAVRGPLRLLSGPNSSGAPVTPPAPSLPAGDASAPPPTWTPRSPGSAAQA